MSVKETIYHWKELAFLSYHLLENKGDAKTYNLYKIIKTCNKKTTDKSFLRKKKELKYLYSELKNIHIEEYSISKISDIFNKYLKSKIESRELTTIFNKNTYLCNHSLYNNHEILSLIDYFQNKLKSLSIKPITIVYTTTGGLQKNNPDNVFTQLRNHFKTNTHTPVITISTEDLINISEEKSNSYNFFTKLNIDRRFRFIDSSIWNYYLPLNDNFENRLGEILEEIEKNYKNELYNTAAAKEFIELHYRIAKNSYLINTEAHSSHVAPFVFHSESKMKEMAVKKLQKLKDIVKDYKGKITWNTFVIDDYAAQNLRITGKETINKSKTNIIKDILKKDGLIKLEDLEVSDKKAEADDKKEQENTQKEIEELKKKYDDSKFEIKFEPTPRDNVLKFTKKRIIEGQVGKDKKVYDILLLDYLLGKKDDTSEREYGYEFFTKKYKGLANYKRPLGKFWIFPVTVFTSALFDRLREQGVSRLNEDWFIASGADPVNTPELFRYNFYNLLEQQLSEAIFTKDDIIDFLEQNALIDDKTETKDEEVRLWAKQVFGSFIHKFGKREILETDAVKGSEFAKTVLKYLHETQKNDYRFYDHIRQLLYLLAYGTGFHATQMWEIVNFVDYEIFINSNNNDEDLKETFRDLIPKYITNLSSFNS